MGVWGDGICSDVDSDSDCAGEVFPRLSMSGSGDLYYRCDHHFALYAERMEACNEETRRRYPVRAPFDFDEAFAGEKWEESW